MISVHEGHHRSESETCGQMGLCVGVYMVSSPRSLLGALMQLGCVYIELSDILYDSRVDTESLIVQSQFRSRPTSRGSVLGSTLKKVDSLVNSQPILLVQFWKPHLQSRLTNIEHIRRDIIHQRITRRGDDKIQLVQ